MTIKNKRKKKVRSYNLKANFAIRESSFFKRLWFLIFGRLYIKYEIEINYKGQLGAISGTYLETSFKK